MEQFFLLLIGHAFADFAFQSDWIAMNKNRHNPSPVGYSPKLHGPKMTIWPYVLGSHALIHAGMVYVITGNIYFTVAEAMLHFMIDFGKCEKWYGIHVDQALHIWCKFLYIV